MSRLGMTAGGKWDSEWGWGAWLACSWDGQLGFFPTDTGSLSFAVDSEAAQGLD